MAKSEAKLKWRSAAQLRGVRAILKRDLNLSEDGAHVQIDYKTARNLLEVCDQAIKTEVGHEPSEAEIEAMRRDLR